MFFNLVNIKNFFHPQNNNIVNGNNKPWNLCTLLKPFKNHYQVKYFSHFFI